MQPRRGITASSVARGVLTWLVLLAAYCALQTFANRISVDLQDWLLLALPLIATVVSVAALRVGPGLSWYLRGAIGSLSTVLFCHAYYQYFRWVIVETLHIWQRNENLLNDLAGVVGLLIAIGAITGAIACGWLGARRAPRQQTPVSMQP